MPGPGEGIPGISPGQRAPQKPKAKPWIQLPDLEHSNVIDVPASVTRSAQGVWHAIGTHLPNAVTRNKAARKSMLRLTR